MSEVKQCPCRVDLQPAKRCPDYDDECVDVPDPLHCWTGGGEIPPADGYCPLMGKESPND